MQLKSQSQRLNSETYPCVSLVCTVPISSMYLLKYVFTGAQHMVF